MTLAATVFLFFAAMLASQGSAAPTNLHTAFQEAFAIGVGLDTPLILHPKEEELALAVEQFSAWTPENQLKPKSVQPRQGQFHFGPADRFVDLAERYGKRIIGHTLVWHSETPDWFFLDEKGEPAPPEVVEQRLRTHIQTVVGRYRGRIAEWDVVNEAIADDGEEDLRRTPLLKVLGSSYLATAFHAAHAADPEAVLIYNDYNIEIPAKRARTLRVLRQLLEDGVPVHAVGIQGHWGLGYLPLQEIENAIVEFSALGLRVMITELDLSVLPSKYWGADVSLEQAKEEGLDPYPDQLPPEVAQQHAEAAAELFRIFWRHRDKIDRVTFWNLHDGVSWKNNFPIPGRTDYPLLFDRELQPKPAFHRVLAVPGEASASPAEPR